MRSALGNMGQAVRVGVDMVLPPRCPGCGSITDADHKFCGPCWLDLDFLSGPACSGCGLPFEHDLGPDARCGECLRSTPPLDGVRAAVAYGDVASKIIVRLKHGGRPAYARTVAKHLARLLPDDAAALLVPVPLHRWRIWRRGYNQSALIASALAAQADLKALPMMLHRHRATPILRGLGPSARARTVKGAFSIDPRQKHLIADRDIILVDDVYTTGATANACARTLKRAGARSVVAICWARVIPEGIAGR